ncbi:MAG: DUF4142 domain-containing protein [Polyangiales bacterium]
MSSSSRRLGRLVPAAVITTTLLVGCQIRDDSSSARESLELTRNVERTGLDDGGDSEWGLSESEILGVLATAHEGQIVHGHMVVGALGDETLRAYAGDIVKAHTRAQLKLAQLSDARALEMRDSPVAQELSATDEAVTHSLAAQSEGSDLDRKYALAQVSKHRELLEVIDHLLLPDAHSPELRQELKRERHEISAQLARIDALAKRLEPEPVYRSSL